MEIELPTPTPYDFAGSVKGHGWYQLAPFRWDESLRQLERVERLDDGRVVLLRLTGRPGAVRVTVETGQPLTPTGIETIGRRVHWMLKLNEDLGPFYEVVRPHPQIWARVGGGGGRLLRCPTLFEDTVKTICTTNTTWRMTIDMVGRLVERLGDPLPEDPARRAFPTAAQVAAADPALFSTEIRLGYRSDYVRQLAREVVDGTRTLEALRASGRPAAELRKALLSIKGVGEYAANNLLMILGAYGQLPVDSEFRAFVGGKYFDGQAPTVREMTAVYEAFGEWKFLAYWFDAG